MNDVNDVKHEEPKTTSSDMLLVVGKTDDKGYSVLRRRGDTVEVGALRELEHGKPISTGGGGAEIVRLERRGEHPLLFDVKDATAVGSAPLAVASRNGPAQVASEEYRAGWDAIFGEHAGDHAALN